MKGILNRLMTYIVRNLQMPLSQKERRSFELRMYAEYLRFIAPIGIATSFLLICLAPLHYLGILGYQDSNAVATTYVIVGFAGFILAFSLYCVHLLMSRDMSALPQNFDYAFNAMVITGALIASYVSSDTAGGMSMFYVSLIATLLMFRLRPNRYRLFMIPWYAASAFLVYQRFGGGKAFLAEMSNVTVLFLILIVIYSIMDASRVRLHHASREAERAAEELRRSNAKLSALKEESEQKAALIEAKNFEIARLNERLVQISEHDALTGVANRLKGSAILEHEWNRAQRTRESVGLLIIDVDFFKDYNDYYGHPKGDECLRRIAEVICSTFSRSSDVVVRYGGEEFYVILPQASEEGARRLAANLVVNVKSARMEHASSPIAAYVTVSVGATSMVPDGELTVDDLFAAADRALYDAKDGGRDMYCYRKAQSRGSVGLIGENQDL